MYKKLLRKGFTLIELLIVIAVIGVLAAAVLVGLDPLEQSNRATDAGTKSSVDQLGRAVTAYFTSQGGTYPAESTTWQTTLKNAGEIQNEIDLSALDNCGAANNEDDGVCYQMQASPPQAAVWAILKSKSSKTKLSCAGLTPVAYVAYAAAQGKSGGNCIAAVDSNVGENPTVNAL